jgi:hypothetical protein
MHAQIWSRNLGQLRKNNNVAHILNEY